MPNLAKFVSKNWILSSFLLLDTKFHRIYLKKRRKLHIFVQIDYEQNLQAWIDHEFDMCALLMAVVTAWYMQKSSMHGRAQCSTMGPRLYEVAIAFITIYFKRFSQMLNTGKSLSEALILASTNPQYDDRLFIELRVQYKKTTSSACVHCVHKLFFVLTFRTIYVHNMFLAWNFHVLN